MENYNFFLEKLRFHLYEPDTIIFIGWYRDDNPKQSVLEVYLDEKKLEVQYNNRKGIPIRQKYLRYQANVNEEINGKIKLPDNWTQAHELKMYSVCEGKKALAESMKVKKLIELQRCVEFYVEKEECIDEKMVLTGWTVGSGTVELELFAEKKKVPAEITRGYRKDVMAVFEEAPEDYLAGFKIETPLPEGKTYELVMTCGENSSHYITTRKNVLDEKKEPGLVGKGIRYLKRNGFRAAVRRTGEKLSGNDSQNDYQRYKDWRRKYEITPEELEQQRTMHFDYEPKFSIVIPLYCTRPKYLREMVDSIRNQTYSNWELCLADGSCSGAGEESPLRSILEEYAGKDARIHYEILEENKGISENTNAAIRMATGEYVVFADHDDILPEHALFECAKVLNEDRTIDVIYSDEDKIDMNGKKYFEPHFKSDFNVDLLCSMNYICHLFVVKQEIIQEVGMLRSEFDGAQDHDFILRCVEAAKNIRHIPKILYHWRCHMESTAENPESKMYAFEAGRRAVEEHYKRIGVPATVEHGQFYGMYKTNYQWKEEPLISILIPNKDHVEDLKKCMDAIEEKSTYRNYEFLIIENNSVEQETFDYYKELEARKNVRVLYYKEEFNFSKINNFGAKCAAGEYLLLLNNDTEIINPECLQEMLGYCMREDVGIVGARLYYGDDTIQHAGVVLGFGGIAGHTFIGSSRYDDGYFSRIICAQDYSAVTAACMMTKKSIYDEVGGLTEEFRVAFNDIDYCMKVRALGKLVVYNPAAELYHYESKSRGLEDTPEKVERFNSEVARFIDRWHEELEAGDPYYNQNLTLDKADFSLKM